MTFCICSLLGFLVVYWSASFERRALSHPAQYAWMIAGLCAAAVFARWRTRATAKSSEAVLHFEQKQPPAILGLGIRK
jgi:hypothetical protein